MVKRQRCVTVSSADDVYAEMREDTLGAYVLYSDYLALQKVVEAFLKRYDEIEPDLNGVFTMYAVHGGKWPTDQNWKAELSQLRSQFLETEKT